MRGANNSTAGRARVSAGSALVAISLLVAVVGGGCGGPKYPICDDDGQCSADGKHPVALSGRVYCWADTSNGPINPGDLLTTSSTAGHAMKVTDHKKAQRQVSCDQNRGHAGDVVISLKE